MSTAIASAGLLKTWAPPATKPLDEAVWCAWVAKGRAQERRSDAAHIKAVKWVSIAGLLVAAGFWSQLAPYEVIIRFIVAAGATILMFQAFGARHYAVAAVFGALALLYNPVVPVFSFSGDWQRAMVVATAIPFVATLTWRKNTERRSART
jgi:uncharacterized membrane protein YoaK (UPF0700 family)